MQNLVGLVLPPIIDLINTKIENSKLRFWVSLLICSVVATLLNLDKLTSGDIGSLAGSISLVFTEAQVIYYQYWKSSGVRTTLQSKLG